MKYDINISKEALYSDVNRLTNQIWKLIPMREHEEDGESHLQSVIVEITGLSDIFDDQTDFLVLLSKLVGLLGADTTFEIYRKTIFECISLLRGILND